MKGLVLAIAALCAPAPGARAAAPPRDPAAPPAAACAGARALQEGAADWHARREAELTRFRALLGSLRSGDEDAIGELRELAARLCELFGRCDTLDVAEYYAALTPEERAQGLADDSAFYALRQRVVEAGEEGLGAGESWSALRAEVVAELDAFATEVRERADFAPAGRALAFLARLEVGEADDGRGELLAQGREHAREALELFARAGQLTPRLEPLWTLGRIEHALRRPASARHAFERCLRLAEHVDSDDFRAKALFSLIALAREAGDAHQVDRYLAEAAAFLDPASSWPLAREHATRLLHADEAAAAVGFLARCPPREASYRPEWHALLGAALVRGGDLAGARREFAALDEGAGGELAVLARATLDLAGERPQRVIDALSAPGVMEGWSYKGQAQACALLGEAWLEGGHPAHAVPWLEAALERARSWQGRIADAGPGGEPPAGSVIGEWIGMHVVVLLARARSQLADGLETARLLEDSQSRTLRFTALDDGDDRLERVSAADVLAWAGHTDLGLVSWGVGADSSVVAHVDAGGGSWAAPLPHGRRPLEEAVRRLREATIAGEGERVARLAREIGEALFPIELWRRLLRGERGARVLFLLHGPLEALPLSTLELGGERLDERFTPLVLPGLPAAAPGAAPRELGGWTLLGSPLDADGELLLPAASRELAEVARLLPDARHHAGAAFTRRALEEAVAGGGPLHVATHLAGGADCSEGRLAPVALLLTGGELLCAEEVFALRPRAPLVVLTVCDSAGGRFVDGEGLHGISRAFLEPGTRNLVVTLWPVEDEAARRFAAAFHRELAAGAPPSRAALAARRSLREAGFPSADWAAFRFMGRD